MAAELRATYRVQFGPDFGFDKAAALASYLAQLGVSHLYCSPYLQAAPGSTHGYDVVDPSRVNEELGGAEAHGRLCRALEEQGLGQVLDIVPNHMAIGGRENPWWWDVLENGHSSRYASYFDVDWDRPESRYQNIILLPVLGDHYGRVLEAGELRLEYQGGRFTLRYYDHTFPIAPPSLDGVLRAAAEHCHSEALAFIADALSWLPLSTLTDPVSSEQRHRGKEVLRTQLARLCAEQLGVAEAIATVVAEVNADFDVLDGLLERQNYRLAFWRTADRELGYRRFFDINNLIGLRVEDEAVFKHTHRLVLDWLGQGVVNGLRIDHPDGLRDPEEYFRRLQTAYPQAWIVIEKILEPGERLRETWPVAGTTGYDFLNQVNGLFVDPASEAPLTEFYAEFIGFPIDYAALVQEKKLTVLRELLGSEINRLTALFQEICERHRRYRDFTRYQLQEALQGVAACFPVYRTYVRAEAGQVDAEDRRYIDAAIEAAKARGPDLDAELFDFLRDLLLLRIPGELEGELVMRFQQLTGSAMAKGVEDTVFYCFNRLVSLNEVGGDPHRLGVAVEAFHRACTEAQRHWPRAMLATSTHDTKRSEDVRARLNLLSETPERWSAAIRRWSARNAGHRHGEFPDPNAEYLLYQTLVGAWPIELERVLAYMEKAAREAKVHTSWTDPQAAYEEALQGFVKALFADEEFMAEVEAFVAPLIEPGRINSLAQTLIKLTAPGVPDLYQGTELWDLSLVDPDNRRPIDYELRHRLLVELKEDMPPAAIWARLDEGLPKLWVIRQALNLRRRQPELFGAEGSYRPLTARGSRADHVVAFVRGEGVITVVPRLILTLGGEWEDTELELPSGQWRNKLTGEALAGGTVQLARLLERFPVCLLSRP